jgi:hypothetical protein
MAYKPRSRKSPRRIAKRNQRITQIGRVALPLTAFGSGTASLVVSLTTIDARHLISITFIAVALIAVIGIIVCEWLVRSGWILDGDRTPFHGLHLHAHTIDPRCEECSLAVAQAEAAAQEDAVARYVKAYPHAGEPIEHTAANVEDGTTKIGKIDYLVNFLIAAAICLTYVWLNYVWYPCKDALERLDRIVADAMTPAYDKPFDITSQVAPSATVSEPVEAEAPVEDPPEHELVHDKPTVEVSEELVAETTQQKLPEPDASGRLPNRSMLSLDEVFGPTSKPWY